MGLYQFGTRLVSTELEICEHLLVPAKVEQGADGAWAITRDLCASGAKMATFVHEWPGVDGEPCMRLRQGRDTFHLDAPNIGTFVIDVLERTISIQCPSETEQTTIEHLLVDQVLPRCLAHDGSLIVHAAGVEVDGEVLMFLGESGQGKSSLAAAFQLSGQKILSDDCIEIAGSAGNVVAFPTYPSLRLLPDTLSRFFPDRLSTTQVADHSDKRRISVGSDFSPADGTPVRAIYLLEAQDPASDVLTIERVPPSVGLVAVTRNLFKLDPTDLRRASLLLEKAAAVVNVVPVFTLRYPRDLGALPAHASTIRAHAATLRPMLH